MQLSPLKGRVRPFDFVDSIVIYVTLKAKVPIVELHIYIFLGTHFMNKVEQYYTVTRFNK